MEYLRANTTARPLGVDREAGMIRGVILAEEGPFKSEGRGEFDSKSISQIVALAKSKPQGLRVRYEHPHLCDDKLFANAGRVRNVRRETVEVKLSSGTATRVVARGDHYFGKAAFSELLRQKTEYIMDLAEDDTEALGMSLVLNTDEEWRRDSRGNPKLGEDGQPLPPLWRPTQLHAVDFVGQGDATNSLLSVGKEEATRDPVQLLTRLEALVRHKFLGKPRADVEAYLSTIAAELLNKHWPIDNGDAEATQDLRRRWEFQQLLLTRCE